MIERTISAPSPVPEEVLRRSRASKAAEEVMARGRLSILDQLAVPKTVDDLEMQITDWRDCRMFFPMEGQPRAYMQIPTGLHGDNDLQYIRWLYVVICWIMEEPRRKAEPAIAAMMWQQFIALRRQFDSLYPDDDPILLFRRHIEIQERGRRGVGGVCLEHSKRRCRECPKGIQTRVSIRIAIPGLDLAGTFPQDSTPAVLTEDML